MQIKGAVGFGLGFLSGEKMTESRDTTLQLPNGNPKTGTYQMHSYRAEREMMHSCGDSSCLKLHPVAESLLPSGISMAANVGYLCAWLKDDSCSAEICSVLCKNEWAVVGCFKI